MKLVCSKIQQKKKLAVIYAKCHGQSATFFELSTPRPPLPRHSPADVDVL